MSTHSVEDIKHASGRLRGTLLDSLANPVTGALADDDQTLIKYHGSYQQDDRDIREERRQQKLEPAYSFMIRTRTPGGVVTPEQWLKLDHIATALRRARPAHHHAPGVPVPRRDQARAQGDDAGDQRRADRHARRLRRRQPQRRRSRPTRTQSRAHAVVHAQAAALSEHLLPNTRAYYEIWLDEERVAGSGEEEEPIYGATYLPRKFKIGFAIPPYNDVDVFAQDLGFIAIIDRRRRARVGYNVTVGGGMGATHGDAGDLPAPGRRDRLHHARPAHRRRRSRGHHPARLGQPRRAQARAPEVHDRRSRPGRVQAGSRTPRRVLPRAGARASTSSTTATASAGSQGEDGRWHLTLRIVAGRIWDREGSRT